MSGADGSTNVESGHRGSGGRDRGGHRGHHGGGGQPGGPADVSYMQQQDYNSWNRNPIAAVSAAMNPADAAYNNFYYSGGAYTPFSAAGDIRDSIAAIWSRTSPNGGEGVPYSGGYGQFPDSQSGQFAANSTPAAGQFAANLTTGHFTSDIGMFGGEYAYGQPQYGYSNQYTQWGETGTRNGGTGYSYLGVAHGEDGGRGGHRMSDVQHGLENMRLTGGKKGESNGYQQGSSGGGPKKMSWANVASQPAKPQSSSSKTKKPGVLPPPAIIPSNKPVLAPTDPNQMMAPPPDMHLSKPDVVLVPPPELTSMPSTMPMDPGHRQDQVPPRSNMVNQGPRTNRVSANGNGAGYGSGARGGNMGGSMRSSAPGNGGDPSSSHPVLESLKSANDYNPRNFDLNPTNARFFVIKSFSEDDIHRSIKYEIWCSTDHGNKRLDAAFKERNGAGPIYLFFSVNGSRHFCGMAEMLSGVDYHTASNVWVQDKFKGQFKVKWIYVKDVPNAQFRHIRLENNENKPVTNSRDTQEVPPDKAKLVLQIIHGYKHQTSIFDDFVHYEKRQEEEGKKNPMAASADDRGDRDHDRDRDRERGDRVNRGDRSDRMDRIERGDRERGERGGHRGGHRKQYHSQHMRH